VSSIAEVCAEKLLLAPGLCCGSEQAAETTDTETSKQKNVKGSRQQRRGERIDTKELRVWVYYMQEGANAKSEQKIRRKTMKTS
jgi:hypothetical protein